jgi:hypothetical protein
MAVNKELREKLPDGTLILDNASYDNSIVGITFDNRLIYSFDKMIEEYMQENNCEDIEAVEWIEYNTIRALPYMGDKAPIIMCEY